MGLYFGESQKLIYKFGIVLEENITIHHECPCRKGKSQLRGRNFCQGRGLLSPWLKFQTRGEISLSYMDWLMMDYFSPTLVNFNPQIRLSNYSGKF